MLNYVEDRQIQLVIDNTNLVLLGVSMAIVFIILPLLAIVEVVSSDNQTKWKVLWIAIIFAFSVFGLAAYLIFARKNLKQT